MTQKTGAIPEIRDVPESIARILRPMKERLEAVKGERGEITLTKVKSTGATNDELAAAINTIIDVLTK